MKAGGGFEREFRRSLERLPGYSMRLYDNGSTPTDAPVLCDFLHFGPGGVCAFECKSTGGASIRLRGPGERGSGVQASQLAGLLLWERQSGGRAYVALNYRRTGACVLVGARALAEIAKSAKSVSEAAACIAGRIQRPNAGGGWDLEFDRGDHAC